LFVPLHVPSFFEHRLLLFCRWMLFSYAFSNAGNRLPIQLALKLWTRENR
jgi:hypothetical protein